MVAIGDPVVQSLWFVIPFKKNSINTSQIINF